MFRPVNFPKMKKGDYFLSKACWLLVFFLAFSFKQFFFKQISFVLEKVSNPGKVGNQDYTLSKGNKGIQV